VTKLPHSRELPQESATHEVNFWLDFDRRLQEIDSILRSDQVNFTLEVLRSAKRFHATVSFIADTGVKEAIDIVAKYNQLMRDMPVNEISAAADLARVKETSVACLLHLMRKIKVIAYPLKRAVALADCLTYDMIHQLLKLINGRQLIWLPREHFKTIADETELLFKTWDDNLREFMLIIQNLGRRRGDKAASQYKVRRAYNDR
jgi:dynein heavy chain 1